MLKLSADCVGSKECQTCYFAENVNYNVIDIKNVEFEVCPYCRFSSTRRDWGTESTTYQRST